ncbi:hypothetical protein ABTY94_35115, partial [Streptomyces sp. NPDC096030]
VGDAWTGNRNDIAVFRETMADQLAGHRLTIGTARTAATPASRGGQPRKHGGVLTFAKPESWHTPEVVTTTDTTRYGTAEARAWDRMHPRLTHRGPWLDHHGELPLLHGTLIRLKVEYLPGDRDPKPVWLWSSRTGAGAVHIDRLWQAFLRRFDLEHTFRLFKQTLGWTAPKFRDPHTADLWTWYNGRPPGSREALAFTAGDKRLPGGAVSGRMGDASSRHGGGGCLPDADRLLYGCGAPYLLPAPARWTGARTTAAAPPASAGRAAYSVEAASW